MMSTRVIRSHALGTFASASTDEVAAAGVGVCPHGGASGPPQGWAGSVDATLGWGDALAAAEPPDGAPAGSARRAASSGPHAASRAAARTAGRSLTIVR